MNGRIATLMVHTSPLDQPGIGDAGGMNIYVTESAERMAAMGVQVDIFTRRTNKDVADIVEISPGVRVRHLNVGPVDGVTKERLPELIGELSLHKEKRMISLDAEFMGVAIDPWGQVKAGFEITGSLDRFDYGLNWNLTAEDGTVVVDKTIKLAINAQFIKQI